MLRREHHVRRAVQRVRTRREDGDRQILIVRASASVQSAISKSTSAPTLLPIQFRCISFSDSGHSSSSRSSSSRSAYAVMRSIHCRIGRCSTGNPPTSLLPSITSSLASTVPSPGHQFTGTSSVYASRWPSITSRCSSRRQLAPQPLDAHFAGDRFHPFLRRVELDARRRARRRSSRSPAR